MNCRLSGPVITRLFIVLAVVSGSFFGELAIAGNSCSRIFLSLRQSYELQQQSVHYGTAKDRASFFGALKNKLKVLMSGQVTKAELKRKFGENWEASLERGELKVDFTRLKDAELRALLSYIQENSTYFKDINWSIDLSGNTKLSTGSVIELLRSGISIHELNIGILDVSNTSIATAIVRHQKGMRLIRLDGATDVHLDILSRLKELRELDLGETVVEASMANSLRFALNRLIDSMVNIVWPQKSEWLVGLRAQMFHFNNYVSVNGIERFVLQQAAPVKTAKGKVSVYNPYFQKIVMPRLATPEVNRQIVSRLGSYLMEQSMLEVAQTNSEKRYRLSMGEGRKWKFKKPLMVIQVCLY